MAIAFDRVQKPLRKLRKSLRNLPADPQPEQVHRLRTRSRQIEAAAAALSPAGEKLTRRLLKSIKPLRKAAGSVRDMDVLAAKAIAFAQEPGQDPGQNLHRDGLARLVEHLQQSRKKSAAGLLAVVDQRKKAARRNLKLYAKQIEGAQDSASAARGAERQAQAAAAQLTAELDRWPALSARNLHSFLLKVKALRSVLQLLSGTDGELAGDPFGNSLIGALGTVKDKIGEWHDWRQLATAAADALDPQQQRELLTAIKKIVRQKLHEALAAADAIRDVIRDQPLHPGAKKPPASERRLPAQAATARRNPAA